MDFKDGGLREGLLADWTSVGPAIAVAALVTDNVRKVREAFATGAAQVRLLLGVSALVHRQVVRFVEALLTLVASEASHQ